jgi:hypothetical protein
MGLRFRRSTRIGPFRITATKSGFSTSVGVPGARVGINSKGQVRRTVGIPGTGVYDTEVVNTRSRSTPSDDVTPSTPSTPEQQQPRPQRQARRGWGAGTITLVVLMAVTILGLVIALAAR